MCILWERITFARASLLQEGSLLHEGTLFHGDSFARASLLNWAHFFTASLLHEGHFCRRLFCTVVTFARMVIFARCHLCTANIFSRLQFFTAALLHDDNFVQRHIFTVTFLHSDI